MAKQDKQQTDEYWRDRALKSESQMNKSVDATEVHILKLFNASQYYIDDRITDLRRRMANRTGMTPEEIEWYLNQPADDDRVIETAQNIMQIKDKKVRQAMMNASTAQAFKFRITREFEIKQSIDATLQRMAESYNDVLTDKYETIASKAYMDAAKELAKPLSVNIGDDVTKQVLETNWFGGNYSDRIWRDTAQLADTLKDLLTVESLTGMSEHQMSTALADKFGVSKGVARRLIRTESNFVHNQARLRSWQDNSIEKYVLIAVKDSRTSVFCRHIDGKVFNVKDAKAEGMSGNYPPFHAWCRTVASAYFGDGKAGDSYDPYDKETFTVPKGSNYDTEMQKRHDIKSRDKMHDILEKLSYDEKQFDNYKATLGADNMPKSLLDYQKLKYNKAEEFKSLKSENKKAFKILKAFENETVVKLTGDEHGTNAYLGSPNGMNTLKKSGVVEQYRTLRDNGYPKVDFDLTDHGNPGEHPIVPHAHDWVKTERVNKLGQTIYKRSSQARKLTMGERAALEQKGVPFKDDY